MATSGAARPKNTRLAVAAVRESLAATPVARP